MIRRIATGLVIAGLAIAPTVAFAKVNFSKIKTEASCKKAHGTWHSETKACTHG